MKDECVRLSKLMAERGICSRREADRYIEEGLVLVDGEEVSVLGTKVSPTATITLKKKAQARQESKVTIILNKPIGYVSTQPEKGYKAAIELIRPENQFRRIKPLLPEHLRNLNVAGRLDIDSKGLLIFTQNGSLVKKIIGPTSSLEKEYIVQVEGVVDKEVLKKLSLGLRMEGVPLKRAVVEQIEPDLLRFTLREGKKRQIRKMCELVHLKVKKLKRVRVGRIKLGNLPEGKWRFLGPREEI